MIAESNISVFEENASEYDIWFERHENIYQSELLALKQAIPENRRGIEIGCGTGRFSVLFNIKFGIEPSENMAQLAEKRGMKVFRGVAEKLPIENESFDFALMVTTVCFLPDIPKAFSEAYRILKPKGEFIVGIIDKNSSLGRKYEKEKSTNKFYQDAHFHSTEEVSSLMEMAGFISFKYWQTLLNPDLPEIEQPKEGYGKGSFVVIKAIKNNQ